MTERSSDFVQSLERGLAVIRAFDADHPELTLSEVARSTGLTRAAARRFLLTLVELGYMRTDGRLFGLRPRILELGYAYLSSLSSPVAQPHLEDLVAEVHESCSVSLLDGNDIVVRRPGSDQEDHDRGDQRGHAVPGERDLDGRVLLASRPADWLDEYLASVELLALTPRTIITIGPSCGRP